MFRIGIVLLVIAVVLGVLGFFQIVASAFIWVLFGGFLLVALAVLAGLFTGLGGKTPMD